jgi:hypothetical protein
LYFEYPEGVAKCRLSTTGVEKSRIVLAPINGRKSRKANIKYLRVF